MRTFSQIYRINKSQAQLDFVNITPGRDIRLFVDPFALSIGEDAWSLNCTDLVLSFFDEVLTNIRNDRRNRTLALLENLKEPNETCLGLSAGAPRGRGVGGLQARALYAAFASSEAARTGELESLEDCSLFVPGIGPDKISDMTTNIIRSKLIEYTQDQCRLHNIEVEDSVPAGHIWNSQELRWEQKYAKLPIINGQKILLVPKFAVRWQISLSTQEYYNHYILNFLQSENLNANSSLVEVLRNGRRRVTKQSVREKHPFSVDFLFHITKENPDILKRYKDIKSAVGTIRDSEFDKDFDEAVFSRLLKESLVGIPAGSDNASRYHSYIIGAIEFIFYPNLIIPKKEAEINDGRKRIDIMYTNAAKGGFFQRIHTSFQIASMFIMVECKNYSRDIANPELDQIIGRFSTNRGRFGIVLCRTFENKNLFIQRCRDTAQSGLGFVLPLCDADLIKMLEWISDGQRKAIDPYLDSILRVISS